MKHHVHTLILLASLTITWLLCSCRTTYQKDRSAQEQSNLSISDSTLYDKTGDIYSRFNFNKEEADKGWKIKVNFDTSKATNPATGLPPISDIEIEGSEKNIKTLLQENDTVHISEKQKTKTDITFQQDSKLESHRDADNSVATGIDNGIKYGLIIGIPIVFIILIFINHAKRQKNTSK